MGDKLYDAQLCFTDACKAAKRGDSTRADYHLTRLNEMKILEDIANQNALTIPAPMQKPNLTDQLPKWIQQVIKDEGVRIGEDMYIKKGPGTVGIKFELKFK